MKNRTKPAAGIMDAAPLRLSVASVLAVCFSYLLSPFLVSAYGVLKETVPRLQHSVSTMWTPWLVYVILNCIILAIFANSAFRRHVKPSISVHPTAPAAPGVGRYQMETSFADKVIEYGSADAKTESNFKSRDFEEAATNSKPPQEEKESNFRSLAERRSPQAEKESNFRSLADGRPPQPRRPSAAKKRVQKAARKPNVYAEIHGSSSREMNEEDDDSMAAIWNAIDGNSKFKKSETWNGTGSEKNRLENAAGSFASGLARESSLEAFNKRASAFIRQVYDQMKMERQRSVAAAQAAATS